MNLDKNITPLSRKKSSLGHDFVLGIWQILFGNLWIWISVLFVCSLIVFGVVGYFQEYTLQPKNNEMRVGFYLEFDQSDKPRIYNENTISDSTISVLSDHNTSVHIALHPNRWDRAKRIIGKLNTHDIPVTLWLLADKKTGYWANIYNADTYDHIDRSIRSWLDKHNLEVEGLALDSEPKLDEDANPMNPELAKSIPIYAWDSYWSGEKYRSALSTYTNIVTRFNDNGYTSEVYAFPPVVDDLNDGDPSIQNMLGVATYPPKNFDRYSFMVYRTAMEKLTGIDFSSYLVYSYGKSIKKHFGTSGSVAINRAGKDPYDSIDTMVKDLRILKNLGFTHARVYSIEMLLQTFDAQDLDRLLTRIERQKPVTVAYSTKVTMFRNSISFMDLFI